MKNKCACGCGKTNLQWGEFYNLQHCLKQVVNSKTKNKRHYFSEVHSLQTSQTGYPRNDF
jgi:hypothetical protein